MVFSSDSDRELIKESLKKTQHRLERESLQRILDRLSKCCQWWCGLLLASSSKTRVEEPIDRRNRILGATT